MSMNEMDKDDQNLADDSVTADFLLDSVRNLMPKCEQDFNNKKIRLHDENFIWKRKFSIFPKINTQHAR